MTDPVVRPARSATEVDAAYELGARIFGPSYFAARAQKELMRSLNPLADLQDVLLLIRGGDVVGSALILDRKLNTPTGPISAGGVTSVCVHPELRGRGFGVALMEAVLERQRERGDVCSILFARRAVDGWYPRLGYVGIGVHPEMRMRITVPPGEVVASMTDGLVGNALEDWAEAYDSSYAGIPLSFHRDVTWWERVPERLRLRGLATGLRVIRMGGRAIGYVVTRGSDILEAACADRHRHGFIDALTDWLVRVGDATLRLPTAHWCVRTLREHEHTLSVRFSWEGGHMVRILDGERFISAVVPGAPKPAVAGHGDLRDHAVARSLLRELAGAAASSADLAGSDGAHLRALPAWSPLDEL